MVISECSFSFKIEPNTFPALTIMSANHQRVIQLYKEEKGRSYVSLTLLFIGKETKYMTSYYGLLIDFHFKESEDQNRDLLPCKKVR